MSDNSRRTGPRGPAHIEYLLVLVLACGLVAMAAAAIAARVGPVFASLSRAFGG
jgi:hypothetical protein